jgi:hypothetical protein
MRAGSVDQVGFTIEQFVTILVYLQFNSVNRNAAADNSPKVRLALCCVHCVCTVAGSTLLSFSVCGYATKHNQSYVWWYAS